MTDPVVAADGQTYQRESIKEWLSRGHRKSPLTGSNLPHTFLTDNIVLKRIIREYQSRIPEEIQQKAVRSNLEKCIEEREGMIQTLIEKLEININQVITSTDVILDIKKDNLALKNHIIQLELKIIQLEEVNLELKKEILAFKKHNNQKEEEVILNLKKENPVLKNKPIEMNIQLNYLSNKKNPPLDVKNFNKCSSYQFDGDFMGILELKDGTISCFTKAGINLLKLNGDTFKLIKTFPLISKIWAFPKQLRNENIIYVNCSEELTICDKDFNLIETLKESNEIWSLCNIREVSFAVGLANGTIKVYSKNSHTQKYERTKEYKPHSRTVYALLYLPKQNYLVSGSIDETIKVLKFV
jgi:hypothetical protein